MSCECKDKCRYGTFDFVLLLLIWYILTWGGCSRISDLYDDVQTIKHNMPSSTVGSEIYDINQKIDNLNSNYVATLILINRIISNNPSTTLNSK